MSDYKTKFKELYETLEESSELFEMEYQRYNEEMQEAIKTGEGEVMALKDISFHLGKMKMLHDIKCLVLEMMIESSNDGQFRKRGE